jgi:hypothetical protein
MTRKVFVKINHNGASGGIKVANQLVNLFRDRGFESYVVLPDKVYHADWMIHPAPAINNQRMLDTCRVEDIVIENWYDVESANIIRNLKAKTKVFYCQASTFYKGEKLIGDDFLKYDRGYTHFFAVSRDTLRYLQENYPGSKRWYLVHPYFELEDTARIAGEVKERKNCVLCFSRKGKNYIEAARIFYGKKIPFNVVSNFKEEEAYRLFASHKFFLHTAIGVSKKRLKNVLRYALWGKDRVVSVISPSGFREGFPLPAAEAAVCGSIVIGFAMYGGLEWMSESTCFLAKDRSYVSLMKKINEALSASDEHLNRMRENALKAVSVFSRENTWSQIEAFLVDIS